MWSAIPLHREREGSCVRIYLTHVSLFMEYLTDKRLLVPVGAAVVVGFGTWYVDDKVQAWLNTTAGQAITPIIFGLAAAGAAFMIVQ